MFGSVLIWFFGLVLVCFVPTFCKGQIGTYANSPAALIVEQSVVRNVFLPEGILVGYVPIQVDCSGASPKLGNFFLSQAFRNDEPFCVDYSRSNGGSGFCKALSGAGKLGFKRIFPKEDIAPVFNLESWRLARVLDVHRGYWSPVGMRDPSLRRCIRSRCFQWRSDINDVPKFGQDVSSQLSFGTLLQMIQSPDRDDDATYPHEDQDNLRQVFGRKQTREVALRMIFGPVLLALGWMLALYSDCWAARGWRRCHYGAVTLWGLRILSMLLLGGGLGAFLLPVNYDCRYKDNCQNNSLSPHGEKLYHKKLTTCTLCNTVNDMANVLGAEKQTAIIAALAEGSSIRSIERITGVHRDTIMRHGRTKQTILTNRYGM